MKKILHRDFYYTIPEDSGRPLKSDTRISRFVFVDHNEFNNPDLNAFLLKILQALHLEIGNNLEVISFKTDETYSLYDLPQQEEFILICFGISPSQLRLQGFEHIHHIYQLNNIRLLFANSLKTYSNESTKKELWLSLKQLFGI